MEEKTGTEISNIIKNHLDDPKMQLTAMRWICRGLAPGDAIRKVLVDKEITDNCIIKKKT